MSEYRLARWRNPKNLERRIYINNSDFDDADVKVYLVNVGHPPLSSTQVMVKGNLNKLPSWYAEEAAEKGISVEQYILRMALEDVGLEQGAKFDAVWAEAD